MRAPAAFAFFAALTLTAAAATAVPLPHYTVAVTLSAKAAEKLSSSGEMVHVNALYYGEAIKAKDGDEMGQIQLGTEDADIPGAGLVELGKVSLKSKALAKVTGHEAILLINVYTSRKKFADNLFDCGIFEDKVSLAAKTPIAIACKLIGE